MTHSIVIARQATFPPPENAPKNQKKRPTLSLFSANKIAALARIRFGAFSNYINERYGLATSLLFDEILLKGRSSYKEAVEGIINRYPIYTEQITAELHRGEGNRIEQAFMTLVSNQFILRVNVYQSYQRFYF